jgi:hypothetical protein
MARRPPNKLRTEATALGLGSWTETACRVQPKPSAGLNRNPLSGNSGISSNSPTGSLNGFC